MSDHFKSSRYSERVDRAEQMMKAADHIRQCNEAQDESDRREKERLDHNARLKEFIAHEIRLAMQQEKLDNLNGVTRGAVADIRAQMIMSAIELGVHESHVTHIPQDHIDRKTAELTKRQ